MVKFEYVGINAMDEDGNRVMPVRSYCGQMVKEGEHVELEDEFFIEKARSNPDYREIKPRAKKAPAKKADDAEDKGSEE